MYWNFFCQELNFDLKFFPSIMSYTAACFFWALSLSKRPRRLACLNDVTAIRPR